MGENHPIGPLALADLIGLDTLLFVIETLYTETSDSKYCSCPLLKKLVRAGNLGRKIGKGFYQYEKVVMFMNAILVKIENGIGFIRLNRPEKTQIYEGTNEIQRIVIAGKLLNEK